MFKKVLVAVAAMVMLATGVLAYTATVNGITWTYFVKDGEAHLGYEHKPKGYGGGAPVSGCLDGSVAFDGSICYHRAVDSNKIAGAITIPSSLDGYPVTSIGFYAFWNCDGLTSVTIPNSVTSIGDYAFHGCSGLRSITIPNSVTSIGDEAFWLCRSLTNVTIPNSVTSIGDEAFYECRYLTSVVIGNSVTSIGDYAFYSCPELTSLEMGNSVISIGNSAFRLCTSLRSITIPDSVTSIGDYAFYNCRGLGLTSVTIPNSVTSIGAHAFDGCSFTSITIGNSVTSIGDYAFQWCDVTSITIPNSVTSIGDGAFQGCIYLESATFLGAAPRYVGYDIFNLCGEDFTIKVKKGTKGWNGDYTSTALPATWHGYPIKYATESAYKVVFNANGGSGSMAAQTIACNTWAKLRANAFKRTGYTFQGWAKSKTGAVAYKDGASVKNLASSGTVTLYAVWKPNTYKVVFNANGGSGSMAAQTIACNTWTKLRANAFKCTGYTFQGWAKSKTGAVAYKNGASVKNLALSGTVTLFAVWKPNTYKIAFNANGGKGKMAATYMKYGKTAKLKKNTFKRSGYVFIGWAKSKKGAVAYKNTASVKNLRPTGTITLYAVWAKTKYKVAFYANGGKGKMSTQTLTYGKSSKLKKNTFKRTGYVFIGWAKSKKGAVAYKNTQAIKNLTTKGSTIKLYARWAKTKYKVAFYANGGSGSMSAQAMTYNKAAYLKKNAFKRTGYTFKGWAKSPTGSVVYTNGKAVKNLTTTGGTVKLYAKWKQITCKIIFHPNGGFGSSVSQTLTYNKAANLRSNTFTRTGYTFAGWATSADGDVEYEDAMSVIYTGTTSGYIFNLYAVWKFDTSKTHNGHKGVQLWSGGPYWATTNIGAEKPCDYGYYFWWGDTIGYKRVNDKWVASDGSLSNFSFESKNTPTAGKNISKLLGEGWITLDEVLVPEHDAASVHWGGQWRMPTDSELRALCNNCTWKKTILNGVYGWAISGKDAYSSAKIFLPIAGRASGTSLSEEGSGGGYWSSVPHAPGWSYYLFFQYGILHIVGDFDYSRISGYPVRPVIGQ